MISDLNTLTHLYVHGTQATDRSCIKLAALPLLKQANFSYTGITNKTLESLAGNTKLDLLDVSDTRIDDEGLKSIGTLTGLRELDLHACNITDAGVENLVGLSRLRGLEIQRTHIGTKSLKVFSELPLQSLSIEKFLKGSRLDQYQEQNPACQISLE
jgi:Leucine-rich repeat (LRR) protein